MTGLVVVTGAPGSGSASLARALSGRLGRPLVALEEVEEELLAGAADTPRAWLRDDAEAELVRRVEAFDGSVVVGLGAGTRADADRHAALLSPWWDDAVEVSCRLPRDAEEVAALGAARTVVVDASSPVDLGDVVAVVRSETGARPRRGPR